MSSLFNNHLFKFDYPPEKDLLSIQEFSFEHACPAKQETKTKKSSDTNKNREIFARRKIGVVETGLEIMQRRLVHSHVHGEW